MTVTVKVLVAPLQMQATQTTQYTATAVKALIDKATVTNTDTVSRTFSVNLVTSGGSAGNSNLVIELVRGVRQVHHRDTVGVGIQQHFDGRAIV